MFSVFCYNIIYVLHDYTFIMYVMCHISYTLILISKHIVYIISFVYVQHHAIHKLG